MTRAKSFAVVLLLVSIILGLAVVTSALVDPINNITHKKNRVHPSASVVNESQFKEEEASRSTIGAADAPAMGKASPAKSKSKGLAIKSKKPKKRKSNNMRWAIHGVATELFHNVVLRTWGRVRTRLFAGKRRRLETRNSERFRRLPRREIAVVTGATGGIGSRMARDLAFRGYDVVVAARDAARGEALVEEIRGALENAPVEGSHGSGGNGQDLPTISFVSYHADVPQSALDVASSLEDRQSPLTVLINNAGIMGKSKQLTMRVNLIGPAMLTFALLPLMTKDANDGKCTKLPTVINVGSSAHLRATESFTPVESIDEEKSWIKDLPDVADDDLSVYAQSKLALMQFSTLLRHLLPKSNPPIQIFDAHPGLVWTPLLRNHIGDKAVETLTKTGLANLIYKSSSEGANAIVSALDSAPLAVKTEEQVYFVNGQPGGYAASESISIEASLQLWKYAIAPEVVGVIELPWDMNATVSPSIN